MTPHRIRIALGFVTVMATIVSAGDQWPEWRGPGGQGDAQVRDLPVSWSETEHVAWKVVVPGRGWSTPVIENGRVWVTTGIDTPASKADAERRRKTSTNAQPLTISESVSLRAVGLDLKTGEASQLNLEGVFIYVGLNPHTSYLKGFVNMDAAGHIATNIWMESSEPGIFAAGDIRQNSASQVITAAGDGATAAIAAHKYITSHQWPPI